MYQFFYCLYLALFSGTWSATEDPALFRYINLVARLVVNALGGNFNTTVDYYFLQGDTTAYGLIANILAIITMCMICFAVLKLVKMVFSIFFGGR